jgi:hypothetical protein
VTVAAVIGYCIVPRTGKGLRERLYTMRAGHGRPLAPFLRREIDRMCATTTSSPNRSKMLSLTERKHLRTTADAFRRPQTFGA